MAGEILDAAAALALEGVAWRRFTFVEGRSDKFWAVRCASHYLETWWGRNGTQGQKKVRHFLIASAAAAELRKMVLQKMAKGYHEEVTPPAQEAVQRRAPTPQRDPLTGRVAVWAQRDVRGAGGAVVHPRGFKQVLPAAVAAELVTGSLDYGYGDPGAEAEGIAGAIGRMSSMASMVGMSAEQFSRAVVAVTQESSVFSQFIRRPLMVLSPGSSATIPLLTLNDEEDVWGVCYQSVVVTGNANEVLSRVTAACTNSQQTSLVVAAVRALIDRRGGRDTVRSAQGTPLGDVVVSHQGRRQVLGRSPQAPAGMASMMTTGMVRVQPLRPQHPPAASFEEPTDEVVGSSSDVARGTVGLGRFLDIDDEEDI